jgi:hypothetical protein
MVYPSKHILHQPPLRLVQRVDQAGLDCVMAEIYLALKEAKLFANTLGVDQVVDVDKHTLQYLCICFSMTRIRLRDSDWTTPFWIPSPCPEPDGYVPVRRDAAAARGSRGRFQIRSRTRRPQHRRIVPGSPAPPPCSIWPSFVVGRTQERVVQSIDG